MKYLRYISLSQEVLNKVKFVDDIRSKFHNIPHDKVPLRTIQVLVRTYSAVLRGLFMSFQLIYISI